MNFITTITVNQTVYRLKTLDSSLARLRAIKCNRLHKYRLCGH